MLFLHWQVIKRQEIERAFCRAVAVINSLTGFNTFELNVVEKAVLQCVFIAVLIVLSLVFVM